MAIPQDRDIDALKASLSEWMNTRPGVSDAEVTFLVNPEASGFSNETLVCDAVYTRDGQTRDSGIVVRKRPTDYAIFPAYDMSVQYRSMQNMAACGSVPVPEILWVEDTGEVLGEPFFIMERLHGRVPSDNPPFFSEGWVFEATPRTAGCAVQLVGGHAGRGGPHRLEGQRIRLRGASRIRRAGIRPAARLSALLRRLGCRGTGPSR